MKKSSKNFAGGSRKARLKLGLMCRLRYLLSVAIAAALLTLVVAIGAPIAAQANEPIVADAVAPNDWSVPSPAVDEDPLDSVILPYRPVVGSLSGDDVKIGTFGLEVGGEEMPCHACSGCKTGGECEDPEVHIEDVQPCCENYETFCFCALHKELDFEIERERRSSDLADTVTVPAGNDLAPTFSPVVPGIGGFDPGGSVEALMPAVSADDPNDFGEADPSELNDLQPSDVAPTFTPLVPGIGGFDPGGSGEALMPAVSADDPNDFGEADPSEVIDR